MSLDVIACFEAQLKGPVDVSAPAAAIQALTEYISASQGTHPLY
jgi:hypothetical protein